MSHTQLLFVLIVCVLFSSCLALAQESYRMPPKRIVEILEVPPTPALSINPQGGSYLLMEFTYLEDLETLARPFLKLAGIRFWPKSSTPKRTTFVRKVVVSDFSKKGEIVLQLPSDVKAGRPSWSPNGEWIGVAVYEEDGTTVWVFDPNTGKGRQVTGKTVNSILMPSFSWNQSGKSLIVPLIPENRGPAPVENIVPTGPRTEETFGKTAKLRTYQDLIKTQHDEDLFAYYARSQPVEINVETGEQRFLGKPDFYTSFYLSPDGKYFLVNKLRMPFSRIVPEYYFGHTLEIWDSAGKKQTVIADLPAAENIPIQGVPEGPRSVQWQPLKPHSLIWTEAQDGGDPAKKVPFREKIMTTIEPEKNLPVELFKLPERFSGIDWLNKVGTGIFYDYDRDRKWIVGRMFDTDSPKPASQAKIIFDRSIHDAYNDPGNVVHTHLKNGEQVGILDQGWIYLAGEGATAEGKRPFLRKFRLKDKKTQTIFQSSKEAFEAFEGFSDRLKSFITLRESPTEPPNYFLRRIQSGKSEKISFFPDPAPELTQIKKEIVKYKRKDEIPLSGVLYYPPDYQPGKKYPTVVYAYPMEYVDPKTAGQVRTTENRFTRLQGSSILFFLLHGYAVLNQAEMPVVGHPETANDTYIEQVTGAAEAAVQFLVDKGITDRDRIGVTGHSYGANMVAQLLAHTDLFAAGIARSGAYNRTLTPFGFQGERRTFWEVPEIYLKLSPFSDADKIKEPILLIHGEIDQNSGTFPIQSERLFAGIKGGGGTARLVMLPLEGHGYQARESVLHVLAEMFDWFDKYVKNRGEKILPK